MIVAGRTVDVAPYAQAGRRSVGPLGVLAPAAFVAVYVAATLIGVPGMPFTLLSPVLFGAWPAVAMMIVASGLIPLLRVPPVAPFAVVNYGFGLAAISLWRYTAWSLVGMVPMNVALVLGLLLGGLAAAGRKAFARS